MVNINPIEYLQSKGFKISSDPHNYASGIFGLRNYTVNGYNYDAYSDGYHNAYDLYSTVGAALFAVVDGTIVDGTRLKGNFGGTVVLADHNGDYQYIYGHCKNLQVKVDDTVKQGDTLAYQSNTNYNNVKMDEHLHFQTQKQKYYADEKTFVKTGIDPTGINVKNYVGKSAATPVKNSNAVIVDISQFQPVNDINYDTFSKQVDHVIIRTMDADYEDKAYKQHHKELQARGIPTAAYAFVRGQNDQHMVNEARMFWNRMKGIDITFMWLDVETVSHPNMRHGVSVYINELRRLGANKVGLYIAHHLYEQLNLDTSEADAIWIPHYGSGSATPDSKPEYPADIHQYTEYGRLPGYGGDLDLNRLLGDKPLEFFTDGQASKIKPATPAKNPAQDVVLYTVKQGDYLSVIAQSFNTTTKALQDLNGLSNPNKIYPGQVLKIKGKPQTTSKFNKYSERGLSNSPLFSGVIQSTNGQGAALRKWNKGNYNVKHGNDLPDGSPVFIFQVQSNGFARVYSPNNDGFVHLDQIRVTEVMI